jgi:hypothetical protein
MNRIALSVGAVVFVLAACSSGEKAAEKDAAPGAETVAEAPATAPMKLQPGEYETTTKVLEFSIAGVPQSQVDAMKGAMSGEIEKPHRYCLTAAQAAEGPARMLSQMRQGDCRTSDFRGAAGSVHGKMECTFEGGAAAASTFDGTFTSDSSSLTLESDQQMAGIGGNGVHMKMQVDTHRVGECSA